MYLKEDLVVFLSELKVEIDDLDRIISEGRTKGIDLSDPDMKDFMSHIEEIEKGILYANATIGLILHSYLSSDTSAIMGIEEEVEKLTDFAAIIKKLKFPITMIFQD